MKENLTNLTGLGETLESVSSLMRWTLWGCALGAAVLLVLFIAAQVRIVRRRREMKRYARFLRANYGQGPVPAMLYRYWDAEVVGYNHARRRWPYRALWEKANAGEFTPQTPSPPKRPSSPAKAPAGSGKPPTERNRGTGTAAPVPEASALPPGRADRKHAPQEAFPPASKP